MKLILSVCLLLGCQLAGCSKEQVVEPGETKVQTQWFEYLQGKYVGEQQIESAITGVIYPYHIYLPANYDNHPDKKYPIIYVLDGQWNFQGFAWGMERNKLDVIVVSIEEGPKDSGRRDIDYRLPAVMDYLDFIKQELMPLVEANYRIDAHDRSFQGTSLGGIAATIMMLTDDPIKPLFKNYIATDAAYWDKTDDMTALISKRLNVKNGITGNLYLSSALVGNYFFVAGFVDELDSLAIPELEVHHEWYLTTHEKALGKSMDDTLRLIYEDAE